MLLDVVQQKIGEVLNFDRDGEALVLKGLLPKACNGELNGVDTGLDMDGC